MPDRSDYLKVAKELKKRLNGNAFVTLDRRDITDILREVSGEPTTRIKSGVAQQLTQILLEQAIRCFPSLEETDTFDTVRIFHAGSVFSNLVDLIVHPSVETDNEVGAMLKKIKGTWSWSTPRAGLDGTLPDGTELSPTRPT